VVLEVDPLYADISFDYVKGGYEVKDKTARMEVPYASTTEQIEQEICHAFLFVPQGSVGWSITRSYPSLS